MMKIMFKRFAAVLLAVWMTALVLTSCAAAVTKNINTCKVAVTLVGYCCNGISEFFRCTHTLFTG